jgi:nucleoside-diphosphate-sugar epimerase
MKVLVTGAGGFIGRVLVGELLAKGFEAVVLVKDKSKIDGLGWSKRVEVIVGNLNETETRGAICKNVDAVVHLAEVAHVSAGEDQLIQNNLINTINLAKAAGQAGAGKFLYVSSSKAEFPRHSAYARLKRQAEIELLALHEEGPLEIICLRPALVFGKDMKGNLVKLLRLLKKKWLPVFIKSDNSIGMIGVRDFCNCIVLALGNGQLKGQCWNISDGEKYTLNELTAFVRAHLGFPLPWLYLPRGLLKGLLQGMQSIPGLRNNSISLSTYKTIFEENYMQDNSFNEISGFKATESFYAALPSLLREIPA